MKVSGIDPGLAGGIAVIDYWDKNGSYDLARAWPMPLTKQRQLNVSRIQELVQGVDLCVIEKVWGMPNLNCTALCTCCKNYGVLICLLGIQNINYREVAARTWQAKMLPKGYDNTKLASIAVCKREAPGVDLQPGRRRKDHDGIADALCMAMYGIRYLVEELMNSEDSSE